MLLTPQTQDIVAIFSPVTCHIYFTSQFVHVGQNQVQSRNFPGCFLCFLGNKIACRASQELVRCSGVSSMRCFIGLDFLGGRNSARATLGKRGLMSSQNLGESRSSTAGLRGPRGQQVGLLPAPFCAWPHALLIDLWLVKNPPTPRVTVGYMRVKSLRVKSQGTPLKVTLASELKVPG